MELPSEAACRRPVQGDGRESEVVGIRAAACGVALAEGVGDGMGGLTDLEA